VFIIISYPRLNNYRSSTWRVIHIMLFDAVRKKSQRNLPKILPQHFPASESNPNDRILITFQRKSAVKLSESICADSRKDCQDMETNTDFDCYHSHLIAYPRRENASGRLFRKKDSVVRASYKQLTPVMFSPEFSASKKVVVRKMSQKYLRRSIQSPYGRENSLIRDDSGSGKEFLRHRKFNFCGYPKIRRG
jgi:hypothetical protein